ncbi:unnamed protein product [Prunus brigantina]
MSMTACSDLDLTIDLCWNWWIENGSPGYSESMIIGLIISS